MTERRKEVLSWLVRGKTNEEIAAILGVSALTVKNHVAVILQIYGAPNRVAAAVMAVVRRDVSLADLQQEFGPC